MAESSLCEAALMEGPTMRTLFLTERVPRSCRLGPADAAFLLAHHAGHLQLSPTSRRHGYRLIARGRVGVLTAPGCRLVIRPKIPLDNLYCLLDPAAPVPAVADRVTACTGLEVLDFLAGQLAARTLAYARTGLRRAYRELTCQGPVLQGRLDLPAQLRQPPTRQDQLHSCFEDFTPDIPFNQLLKTTLRRLGDSGLAASSIQAALRLAGDSLEGVTPSLPVPVDWPCLRAGALTPSQQLLLDLCELLLQGLTPGEAAGPTPAPAFLLDLERAWERHVSRLVVEAFAGTDYPVSVQQPRQAARTEAGPPLVMQPDLTVEGAAATLLVVDAKWKRPGRHAATPDLYQVLAYAAALGAPAAVLVYPGRRDRCRLYRLAHAPRRLALCTVRVEGTPAQGQRSARRLGRALRAWASAAQRL
jgi:5-methylcytosine-specific restriction enzyme subunit McrC